MSVDAVVIGAGLSGLVTAYALQRVGRSVTVLEAAARPGGVIGTLPRDGCLIERGPNTAMDLSDAVAPLLDELGLAADRLEASAAAERRYLVCKGQLQALPGSAGSFLTTPLFSAAAKMRLLREPFAPAAAAGVEESVAAFVRRRLGPDVLEVAVEPFVAGIYGGDPEELSLAATFPRLQALEARGGLLRGGLALARERGARGAARRRPRSFSFRGGMQALTDALAARLPGLTCAAAAVSLHPTDNGWVVRDANGHAHSGRSVIVATPAYAASALVRPIAPAAAAALAAIDYAPIIVVATVQRRSQLAHPLDGFGFLVPAREPVGVLGTLFSSTMFAGRSAGDTVLLTSFLGGRRHPEHLQRSDDELLQLVAADHRRLLGASGPVLSSEIVRWPRAIPQTTAGHDGRLATLRAAEQQLPGLYFCGNYRGGVSISDCIDSGQALAARVAQEQIALAI